MKSKYYCIIILLENYDGGHKADNYEYGGHKAYKYGGHPAPIGASPTQPFNAVSMLKIKTTSVWMV